MLEFAGFEWCGCQKKDHIDFLQNPSQLLHYIIGHIYRWSRQTIQIILIPEYREES